ncbi:MAG: tyrosine-type recombinase/integrase [Ktedonobacteraceae bacterium]
MSRRGHGEGSIYQRKDGRWAGSITLEGRKRKTFYGKTRKEVQEQLKVALHQKQQGTLVSSPRQTVEQFLTHWLEKAHKSTICIRTYIRYQQHLRVHIIPALGHYQLQKLSPQHLQAFYTLKLEEGLSAQTVFAFHSLLHKALDTAVRWSLLSRNVCDAVSPPRPKRHEIHTLTPEQAQQLLKAVNNHRLKILFVLALATGMRLGELLCLKWQDINDGSLQVRRTLYYVSKVGFVEAEPKTEKSRRNIILPAFVLEELKQHRIRQLEERLKAGEAWQEHNLVICTVIGGYISPGDISSKLLRNILQKAGLPRIRFHDLRHSAATLLLSMGVHPKVVQELLGHSQISMTMDIYSHVLPTMQKEAMEKINTLLQGQR